MIGVVEGTASECFMPLTVGGGLRSVENIRDMLNAGADKVSLNTAAISIPTQSRSLLPALVTSVSPSRSTPNAYPKRWEVEGLHTRRPKRNQLDAVEWAKVVSLGAGEILLTSMDCDGTKAGDNALNRAVSEAVEVPVIASGGAGTLDHLADAISVGKTSAV